MAGPVEVDVKKTTSRHQISKLPLRNRRLKPLHPKRRFLTTSTLTIRMILNLQRARAFPQIRYSILELEQRRDVQFNNRTRTELGKLATLLYRLRINNKCNLRHSLPYCHMGFYISVTRKRSSRSGCFKKRVRAVEVHAWLQVLVVHVPPLLPLRQPIYRDSVDTPQRRNVINPIARPEYHKPKA